jgi:polyphosphate kinase
MADVNRIFSYLEKPKTGFKHLRMAQTLLLSPTSMRRNILALINAEIKQAMAGKKACITLKMNSLSDEILIQKLYDAATAGVEIKMVVRGIFCAVTDIKKFKFPIQAISIVDEYLEHARIMVFYNGGKEKVFISSADWMVRNLDHRIEVTCPIYEPGIMRELKDILDIQFRDNVKARLLSNNLSNEYVSVKGRQVRSQIETYQYLLSKAIKKTPKPA